MAMGCTLGECTGYWWGAEPQGQGWTVWICVASPPLLLSQSTDPQNQQGQCLKVCVPCMGAASVSQKPEMAESTAGRKVSAIRSLSHSYDLGLQAREKRLRGGKPALPGLSLPLESLWGDPQHALLTSLQLPPGYGNAAAPRGVLNWGRNKEILAPARSIICIHAQLHAARVAEAGSAVG